METERNRHIDAIRRRFGITLKAVSLYNSLNRDEITNSGKIFCLKGTDREKVLALLYMISFDEQDNVIRKFCADTGLNDAQYNSAGTLIDRYGTMLTAALIYNPLLYAMAVNYYGAINAGFAAGEVEEDSLYKAKEDSSLKNKKNNIRAFKKPPFNSRMVFAAAAVFAVVFFIALLFRTNNGTGRRISNDWIAGLTEPQRGQDGVSFVSDGKGARIGITSPLVGIAMASDPKKADVSDAAAYYTKAIGTEKNNAALYVNRGIAHTLQGYVDSAIADFNKAIELEPDNTSAYFNRAVALAGKGKTDDAIADLMTVISINPGDSETYYALGVLYFRQYENDETKSHVLLEKSLDTFLHIQGYKDADFIFDYLSRLL
ncbi:MAG: tetratricopeptide repeat protein [Spirochaetaceae bacterium]|nr:tetratricopeptide repeat protein [Spirochaetaceae bacterium]